jgi:hypothetical protein
MRTVLILVCGLLSGSVLADTVLIEASQDNTLYQSSQGALSNGAGDFLFAGQTVNFGARRAVLAFKDLSAIPAGATIVSVKLHMYVSKENADPTSMGLIRLQSDWGEGSSNSMGAEGQGAMATSGDATWNHRFFDNMVWNSPGGDFANTDSARRTVSGVGAYEFGSTDAMVADVKDWLDNPSGNFGWILIANEEVTSARRFNSREHFTEGRGPMIEVEFTQGASGPAAGSDFTGPWFDSTLDGEGYLIFQTPAGWLIYYFGYTADGKRLWLISNLLVIDNLAWGQEYEFSMLVGTPGSFSMPSPSTELTAWGILRIQLSDCFSGVFVLDGIDGLKTANVIKIVGVEGTSCVSN